MASETLAMTEVKGELTSADAQLDRGELAPGADYSGASLLVLDQQSVDQLAEPFANEALDVKPTGEVFVSQVHYRRRLNQVFGPGQWALVPHGEFQREASVLMREYILLVRGHFIAEAIGECEYQEANDRMTWADAAEGVKSNALTRACKDLGIASECWDRQFANRWRAEHCIQVWVKGKNKPQYRRLDAPAFYQEDRPTDDWRASHGDAAPAKPAPPTEPGREAGEDWPDRGEAAYTAHGVEPPKQAERKPAAAGNGPACPRCGKLTRPSKFPKAGAEFYCTPCKTQVSK